MAGSNLFRFAKCYFLIDLALDWDAPFLLPPLTPSSHCSHHSGSGIHSLGLKGSKFKANKRKCGAHFHHARQKSLREKVKTTNALTGFGKGLSNFMTPMKACSALASQDNYQSNQISYAVVCKLATLLFVCHLILSYSSPVAFMSTPHSCTEAYLYK